MQPSSDVTIKGGSCGPRARTDCARRGSAIELVLYFFALLAVLAVVIVFLIVYSPTRYVTLITLGIGTLLGAAAWFWKKAVDAFEFRARLLIGEELNRRGALTRAEIRKAVARDKVIYRMMTTMYANALAEMVKDGAVSLQHDGRYALPRSSGAGDRPTQ